MSTLNPHFLPYQIAWLQDKSPIKIWEKSRRIGADYTESYQNVKECATGEVPRVYYSSSDEDAAKGYLEYCEHWAKVLNIAAKYVGEEIIDVENDVTAYRMEFSSGSKIYALSSNPRRFRSKGGKVVLSEFAHHDNERLMWKAVRPVITWGYPLVILSTHNETKTLFNQFIQAAKKGDLNWSHHFTDIHQAVEDGLLDKIKRRKTSKKEREEWIAELRTSCFDDSTWAEEYCCNPIDEASAFLPYELITPCEQEGVEKELDQCTGGLYLGMDIGRRKDLSVIWTFEKLGPANYTREIKVLDKAPFRVQREELFARLRRPNVRRACIDATGLGMQLAEETQEEFGKYRVEAVNFTNPVKSELAYGIKTLFEDKNIMIPTRREIREDLHSIRKLTTSAGNVRLDTESGKKNATLGVDERSHGDYFWACALAAHASDNYKGPVTVKSSSRSKTSDLLRGYYNV